MLKSLINFLTSVREKLKSESISKQDAARETPRNDNTFALFAITEKKTDFEIKH